MALPRLRETIRFYMKDHIKNSVNSCSDSTIECLLSDEELKEIHPNFDAYIRNKLKKQSEFSEAAIEKICDEMEATCIFGAKTFTHIFITTLLDKYFRPYFIEKYHDIHKAGWIIEIMKGTVTFSLLLSLTGLSLDVIIRKGLKSAMQAQGFENEYINVVTNRISSVVAFTQNPLSLAEIGIYDTAAEIGQKAAFAAIHLLPKLRHEAAAPAGPDTDNNHHGVPRIIQETHPGLHHRHPAINPENDK